MNLTKYGFEVVGALQLEPEILSEEQTQALRNAGYNVRFNKISNEYFEAVVSGMMTVNIKRRKKSLLFKMFTIDAGVSFLLAIDKWPPELTIGKFILPRFDALSYKATFDEGTKHQFVVSVGLSQDLVVRSRFDEGGDAFFGFGKAQGKSGKISIADLRTCVKRSVESLKQIIPTHGPLTGTPFESLKRIIAQVET